MLICRGGGLLQGRGTNNLEVYLKFLKARDLILQFIRESNLRTRQLAEEVIRLDPDFPSGYHTLAVVMQQDVFFGVSESPRESRMKAIRLDQKAISLYDSYAPAHAFLGMLYAANREYEKGIAEGKLAIEIAPNLADAHAHMVISLCYSGRPEEALAHIDTAFRLNPVGPPSYYYLGAANTYRLLGRYADGIKMSKVLLSRWPDNFLGHLTLVLNYAAWNHDDEVRAAAKDVLRIEPNFSAQRLAWTYPYKDPTQTASVLELLRKAGLPD
jgi:adenylate cyclase